MDFSLIQTIFYQKTPVLSSRNVTIYSLAKKIGNIATFFGAYLEILTDGMCACAVLFNARAPRTMGTPYRNTSSKTSPMERIAPDSSSGEGSITMRKWSGVG